VEGTIFESVPLSIEYLVEKGAQRLVSRTVMSSPLVLRKESSKVVGSTKLARPHSHEAHDETIREMSKTARYDFRSHSELLPLSYTKTKQIAPFRSRKK
jgi:hypothetical protein